MSAALMQEDETLAQVMSSTAEWRGMNVAGRRGVRALARMSANSVYSETSSSHMLTTELMGSAQSNSVERGILKMMMMMMKI